MPVNADNTGSRPHWAAAFFAVRREMYQWITDALHRHASIPYGGGHDEGSFIASWLTDHLLFGDERVLDFARFLRDGFAEWSREHLLHGFYRSGEAHHQTEIYNCFLARLCGCSRRADRGVAGGRSASHRQLGRGLPALV